MAKLSGREKQIVDERIKKIEKLRGDGVNPYPSIFKDYKKRVHAKDVLEEFYK